MNENIDASRQTDFQAQHRQYVADCCARHAESIRTLPPRLTALGIAVVTATYSGCGDSGQFDEIHFRTATDKAATDEVPKDLQEEVETLLYDALEARHGGWENNDGGEGEFQWTLATGTFEHVHRDFYIQSDSSYHDGFEDLLAAKDGEVGS